MLHKTFMTKPLFSLIIPSFNEEAFLPKLLTSISCQTANNFEVIVVNGSSTDKTEAVALSYKKLLGQRLRIVTTKANLPFQRNIGAKKALGEWLIFIDADSILLPYFVERIGVFIEAYHPRLFTTWSRPDTENSSDALMTLLLNLVFEGSLRFKRPVAPGPLTCVKKSVFTRVHGYDETLAWGEDFDFTQRVCKTGVQFMILREALYVYSLRRFRHEKKLKLADIYTKVFLSVLLTKKTPRRISGYVMGGQLYEKKKKSTHSKESLRTFEAKFRTLLREFFS